ncbi:MAG: pilus assembly protein PilM [Planctomycetota bacterium]|nr:pilus assembly protein PilM [Planctomycetota bacterium]
MLPAAWGLDLGKSSLKAVKLHKDKDEVAILSVAHIEYGAAGGDARAGVRSALRTFLDTHTVKGDKIVVAMPGRMAFSRFIKLPPLSEVKKVDEIVRYEAQQQIPFPIDEVVWDYQRLDENGTSATST